METPEATTRKRSSNLIPIVLASIALILAVKPCVVRNPVEWPGVSFIRLRDEVTGEMIGFIKADYGTLKIVQVGRGDSGRTELSLHPDGTVNIEGTKGVWNLNAEGKSDSAAP